MSTARVMTLVFLLGFGAALGVVVAQRPHLHARRGRERRHLGGRVLAVGGEAVGVQVDRAAVSVRHVPHLEAF